MDELIQIASDYAESIITISGALAAIGAVAVWIYRKIFRPAIQTIDAINELISVQLNANGGYSLIDKVNRLETYHVQQLLTNKELTKSQRDIVDRLRRVESQTCPYIILPEEIEVDDS